MEGSIDVTDGGYPQAGTALDAAALLRRVETLEAELAHSQLAERSLRQALSSASMAFFALNPSGEALWANALLPQLLGLQPEALAGRRLSDFLIDSGLVEQLLSRLQQGEAVRDWPVALRAADGSVRHVSLGADAVLENGRFAYGLCFMQDVTEALRLRDALQQQALRLSLSERRRDDMLATLGHELRNRLTVIDASLTLMRRGGADGWDNGRDTIARQTELLNHLVDDLLDAEQLNAGALALRQEPLQLGQVLQKATELAQRVVDARAHSINAEPPSEPALLSADPERLAQALGNLLAHAARHAPGSGSLTLGGGREGASAVIWVVDDGVPAAQRNVFEPANEGRFQPASGPGLMLARRIVELHGGAVEMQDGGNGPGIRFLVRLPLLQEGGSASGGGGGIGPSRWSGSFGVSRAAAAPRG